MFVSNLPFIMHMLRYYVMFLFNLSGHLFLFPPSQSERNLVEISIFYSHTTFNGTQSHREVTSLLLREREREREVI